MNISDIAAKSSWFGVITKAGWSCPSKVMSSSTSCSFYRSYVLVNYATIGEFSQALNANLTKAARNMEGTAIGDPLVVAAMQNILGLSFLGLGETKLAIGLFEMACTEHRTELGAEHPDTLTSTNNLALGYLAAGNLDLALPLFVETTRHLDHLQYPLHARWSPPRAEEIRRSRTTATQRLRGNGGTFSSRRSGC